jgi:hypothetical protein
MRPLGKKKADARPGCGGNKYNILSPNEHDRRIEDLIIIVIQGVSDD